MASYSFACTFIFTVHMISKILWLLFLSEQSHSQMFCVPGGQFLPAPTQNGNLSFHNDPWGPFFHFLILKHASCP